VRSTREQIVEGPNAMAALAQTKRDEGMWLGSQAWDERLVAIVRRCFELALRTRDMLREGTLLRRQGGGGRGDGEGRQGWNVK